MSRCNNCGRQMRVLRVMPVTTAMAPGYEYHRVECPGGHGSQWRLVFNRPIGEIAVEPLGLASASFRALRSKAAVARARDLLDDTLQMLTGMAVRLRTALAASKSRLQLALMRHRSLRAQTAEGDELTSLLERLAKAHSRELVGLRS